MNNDKFQSSENNNLLYLLEVLWNGKKSFFLIFFLILFVGIIYIYNKSESHSVTTQVKNGKDSIFIEYTSINDVLIENETLASEDNSRGYLINSSGVFDIFVSEFNDYVEMIEVLKNNEYVKNQISTLDDDGKQNLLLSYAKLFEIKPPGRKETIWNLKFKWHDVIEGQNLFENAINLTLQNVKSILLYDINQLAIALDMKKLRALDVLSNELDIITRIHEEKNFRHLQFLEEQSAIAKELGIVTTNLDAYSLSQSGSTGVSVTINNEIPFYLRGYNAIDKEISLIKSRSPEVQLLMAKNYLETKEKILLLENAPASKQLRNGFQIIENDDPIDWVEYNFGLADIKSQNQPIIYFSFFVILGFVLGVTYVLIYNFINSIRRNIN